MPSRRPNLFVIGAMKSGTSSLHKYLGEHPQIYMTEEKEPHYFVKELNWRKGEKWYLDLFRNSGDAKIIGESSTYYTKLPTFQGIAERIEDFAPDAKFIYIMRDPVKRCISQYWHHYQARRSYDEERRDMLTAFRENECYLAYSNYAMQLRPYLERFGERRVFTLTMEEFLAEPAASMHQIFDWLGVDPEFHPSSLGEKVHQTAKVVARRNRFLHKLRNSSGWEAIRWAVPSQLIRLGAAMAERNPVDRSTVSTEDAVAYISPILKEYVDDLSTLLNRDFTEWDLNQESVVVKQTDSQESSRTT